MRRNGRKIPCLHCLLIIHSSLHSRQTQLRMCLGSFKNTIHGIFERHKSSYKNFVEMQCAAFLETMWLISKGYPIVCVLTNLTFDESGDHLHNWFICEDGFLAARHKYPKDHVWKKGPDNSIRTRATEPYTSDSTAILEDPQALMRMFRSPAYFSTIFQRLYRNASGQEYKYGRKCYIFLTWVEKKELGTRVPSKLTVAVDRNNL